MDLKIIKILFYIYLYISLFESWFFISFVSISTHLVYRICFPEFACSILSYIYIYMYVSFLFGCKSAGNFTIRMERRFAASLSSASTLRPPCIYTIVALYAWKLLTYADIYIYEEEGVGRGWLATRQMEWNGIIREKRGGDGRNCRRAALAGWTCGLCMK